MTHISTLPNLGLERARRGIAGYAIREGSALAFAMLLWLGLWGWYQPALATPESAMWQVFWVGLIALAYTAFHALAAATQPLSSETLPLIDILVSLVPLGVVAYTGVEWVRGEVSLSDYQKIVMILGTMATLIDTVVFTWFSLRLNRLAHEFVRAD
ncbi:MAG: hypothetical protein J2P54_02545 [Bradyrhizobiaceae bacterium]|nr:hypothetical protein [Bradyrhizobiaceae bacterium]